MTEAPPVTPVRPEVRVGLYVLVAWLLAIGVSLFVFTEQTDRYFSWTIEPPLTAAFLGAAYWSGALLALAGARARDWTHARAHRPGVGRDDPAPAGHAHPPRPLPHGQRHRLGLVERVRGMPPVMAYLVVRQLRAAGPDPPRLAPFAMWFRRLLQIVVAGALTLGLALFLFPSEADAAWPWTLTPLTARAIAAGALGGAIFLALVAYEDDWLRVRSAMLSLAAFGALQLLAVARYPDTLDWDGSGAWIYVGALVATIVVGVLGSRAAGARSGRSSLRSAGV